jgi:CBS domain-containing membrane protein
MLKAKDRMTTDLVTVDRDDTIREAVSQMMKHHLIALPVVDHNRRVVGLVVQSDLLDEIWDPLTCDSPVVRYMQADIAAVDENDDMSRAAELLRSRPAAIIPVTREGRLIGILARDDVRDARRDAPQSAPIRVEPHFLRSASHVESL